MTGGLPSTVALELSSLCRLDCSYCDKRNWATFGGERNTPFMDMQLFRFIVDELSEYPSTSVTLSYEGESLLHPKFVEALSYLNHRGIRPWITTTLMGAREEVLRALLYGCTTISISIATSDEEFLETRGPLAAYRETMASIEKLVAMRHNANGARLAVNSILRRGVTLQSERVMAFISKWSPLVDEIHLWFELDYGAHIRYLHRTGITRHLIRRRWCMQPFSYLAVLSDGSLSPCCQTSRVRFSAVGADAGLKAAMKHPEYLKFLEMHAQRRVEGTPCENCEAWLDDWLSDEIFSFGSGFSAAIEGSTARLTAFRDAG